MSLNDGIPRNNMRLLRNKIDAHFSRVSKNMLAFIQLQVLQ